MKYQQIPLSRLSRAAEHLLRDDAWHPYRTEDTAYYRVSGRTMQRLKFEADESTQMLQLFESIPPLPSRLLKEGFREEISIRVSNDTFVVDNMRMRLFVGWDQLAAAGRSFGIDTRFHEGNSLEFSIALDSFSARSLIESLLTARAFSIVGADLARDAREGVPHTVQEIRGLIATARDVLCEEILPGQSRSSETAESAPRADRHIRRRHNQTSLFQEEQE